MTVLSATTIDSPYLSYSYSYPHKTAYRKLPEPVATRDAWKDEKVDSLFLYMHIPFCEMRCGFCNLFTMTNAGDALESSYLRALELQAKTVSDELAATGKKLGIARVAIGGGTPTFLSTDDLEKLLDIANAVYDVDFHSVPCSVETSPMTSEDEKLDMLKHRGVSRISIGIQSFVDDEVRAVGRSQSQIQVHAALQRIAIRNFSTFNIDLIYGIPGQTETSFLYSLKEALKYEPEELYLYPLYVRPLTGLGKRQVDFEKGQRGPGRTSDLMPDVCDSEADLRLSLYRRGREYLLEHGYVQNSMRMFRSAKSTCDPGPIYCCQTDGMIGIGCGSRSYTQSLHYSDKYAVTASSTRHLIEQFVNRDAQSFRTIGYGIELDDEEQKRRYIIQSLLQADGLNLSEYRERFTTDALNEFEELSAYCDRGWFDIDAQKMIITASGLELSDALGVSFYSQNVQQLMSEYQLT